MPILYYTTDRGLVRPHVRAHTAAHFTQMARASVVSSGRLKRKSISESIWATTRAWAMRRVSDATGRWCRSRAYKGGLYTHIVPGRRPSVFGAGVVYAEVKHPLKRLSQHFVKSGCLERSDQSLLTDRRSSLQQTCMVIGIQKATVRKNMRSKWHTSHGLSAAIAEAKLSDDRVAHLDLGELSARTRK